MKRSIFQISLAACALLQVACSDVGFTPTPQKSSESDGSIDRGLSSDMYETFFASAANTGGKVDILFVIDNSTSMSKEQRRVAERLETFIQSLDGLDWQIGITTTDVSNGMYGLKGSLIPFTGSNSYILTNRVQGFEQKFKDTVVRNETIDCEAVCPSSNEQPIKAAMQAIDKRNTDNRGFFRPDASLAIVMMSDEDEMSDGSTFATTPKNFIDHVAAGFNQAKRTTVFGIVIRPGDTACYDAQDTRVYYGSFVAELTQMTGGVLGSICDDDYSKNLTNIGERVQELANEVVLSKAPKQGSVSIQFTPTLDATWNLSGRKVIFSRTIPEGTKIDVSYKEF
jgi:hypothetical protein